MADSKVASWLLDAPIARTVMFGLSNVATGVLTGALVFKITKGQELLWVKAITSPYLYGLAVLLVVIYIYNRAIYQHDQSIRKFGNDEFCRTYVRSQCLPEAVKMWNESIAAGDTRALADAKRQLENFLR